MVDALTRALEAVKAASEALPLGAWESQAKLLAAFDAISEARRLALPPKGHEVAREWISNQSKGAGR